MAKKDLGMSYLRWHNMIVFSFIFCLLPFDDMFVRIAFISGIGFYISLYYFIKGEVVPWLKRKK